MPCAATKHALRGMFYAARPWLTKHALRGGFLAHARRFFESKNRRCAPTKHALRGGFLAKTSHTLGAPASFFPPAQSGTCRATNM